MSSPPLSSQPQPSTSSTEQRPRIKLTIKPLKLKLSSSSSSVNSPARDNHDDAASTPPSNPTRHSITIKPLKLKQPSSSSFTEPARPLPVHIQDEEPRPRPKIKLKPLVRPSPAPAIEPDGMDIDEQPAPSHHVESEHVEAFAPPPPPPPPIRPARPPPPPKVKVPRPIKLKPLKEVLLRVITMIKKKDDYAFFLNPVDPTQIPGYSDVVKHPMDFGTMTEKVEKNRYRSLEQFKDDFCLVTSNAKAFNPPPSLYNTEASKIETWGLDQIARSAAQVIEYETDWTIDVVADEEPGQDGGDDSMADAAVAAGEIASRARSPSVMSSIAGGGTALLERSRKAARGKKALGVTENWEERGHLPGAKDGIGVFPPNSEFAALMLELKLKGKRFRTKKERLKREKEGPPFAADGSLDYTEMENPYTFFQKLAPKLLTVPQVIPLINTRPPPAEPAQTNPETSQPPEDTQEKDLDVDGPVSVPPDVLPALLSDPSRYSFPNPPNSTALVGKKKLRHWTVTRNPPRARGRDEDEDVVAGGPQEKRRRVEHTDYASFANLMGKIASENGLRAEDFEETFGSNEKMLAQIRMGIESHDLQNESSSKVKLELEERERLLDSEEYIRDMVYGGVNGLAYFRSLAEFVGEYDGPLKQKSDLSVNAGELGMPLAQWVATHIIDPLTMGNHATLRTVAETLARSNAQEQADASEQASHAIARYLALANEDRTTILEQVRELDALGDPTAQIDIAPLLYKPEELFLAETEWAGRDREGDQKPAVASADPQVATALSVPSQTQTQNATIAGAGAVLGLAASIPGQSRLSGSLMADTPGAIAHALNKSAEALHELGQRTVKLDGNEEDALMRRTRLTLIALAKRAPIDRIARLPPELVPLHVRHIIPTKMG